MEINNWLESLDKVKTNNIGEFLKILEIDFSNVIKILVSGNSSRVTTITTLKEVLNFKKFNSGAIIFSLDEVSYKNKLIDEESYNFHLGCIKQISEESNLSIGYYEALYLAYLNFFREQKSPIIIIEDSFDFIRDIEFNYELVCSNNSDAKYSYKNLDKKDYFLYNSELCSFSYKNLDYDALNYGSFNAFPYILAVNFINDIFPEIKDKKIRNIINDIKPNMFYQRVNRNPRVIINYIVSDSELEESINNLKAISNRDIVCVSNIDSSLVNYVISSTDELANIINSASIDVIVYIVFNKLFVNDIKRFFIN